MKPTATTGFIALSIENPATELADFDRVIEHYRGRILRFVFASVRDMDLAETLTQDCLLKAYVNRHTFRGESSLLTWLIKIAINLIRDMREAAGFSSGGRPARSKPKLSITGRMAICLRSRERP